jgi:hypothetical protein
MMNRRTFIEKSATGVAALSTVGTVLGRDIPFRGWTARDGELLSPNGAPAKLCGYRIQIGDAVRDSRYTLKQMQALATDGLLGSCSAVEIWFGNDNDLSPGEKSVLTPDEYNEPMLAPLVEFMRDLIKAGSYVIPSFRLNPIPELQRTWLRGILNLYNETTNGFGFHAWPPSWASLNSYRFAKPGGFDETDFLAIMRKALQGEPVSFKRHETRVSHSVAHHPGWGFHQFKNHA